MAKNDKKVTSAVNQNKVSNVNTSVDSSNKAEPKVQPTKVEDKVKGDAGLSVEQKAAREAELAKQAPKDRLHTSVVEKPYQPT